jgi:hypothetical protein
VYVIAVDDRPPFFEAMHDTIHRFGLEPFRAIHPFAQPKNPAL